MPLASLVLAASCGGDRPSVDDARGDAARPEDTASLCSDGVDNDGDGFTDCDDQDCWSLKSCARDAGASSDGPRDAGAVGEGPERRDAQVDSSLATCTIHYDCVQGEFCYKGSCLRDAKQAVYHCDKAGCPPGQWCLNQANGKERCAEDPRFYCDDACDCGPAHCCLNNRCVRDLADAWITGPVGGVNPPGKCTPGVDATYCCERPECHAGYQSAGLAVGRFRCHAADGPRSFCGGNPCFGTACRCAPGESCVDVVDAAPEPGKSCGLFSGGACLSNALAEAVYGFAPADLLPCCEPACTPGVPCDAGWRSDGEHAYVRVAVECGGPTPSCPADCLASCGDARCFPEELGSCSADCGPKPSCGIAAELNTTWRKATICGDGVCQGGRWACDWSEPESCRTCRRDCGVCDWERRSGSTAAPMDHVTGVWGSSAADVFAVGGSGSILHYDGVAWRPMTSGSRMSLNGVWGSSSSNVVVVGGAGTILRYDGVAWTPMPLPSTVELHGVWGSSGTDVLAVGDGGTILRYDGAGWQLEPSGTTVALRGVWGSSNSDVYAVGDGGTILHYDGAGWTAQASGTTSRLRAVSTVGGQVYAVGDAGTVVRFDGATWQSMSSNVTAWLYAVWGRSPDDVFAVGDAGTILHYDGKGWAKMSSGTSAWIHGVWGSSAGDVFAVGERGAILRLEGTSWSAMTTVSGGAARLQGVWGASSSALLAVGAAGTILRHDGVQWQPMTSGTTHSLHGIWGSSWSDVVAVGDWGTILRFDGTTWKPELTGYTSTLNGVWGSAPTNVIAVGESGIILRYDGAAWQGMASGATETLNAVWGASASDVYAVGDSGTFGAGGNILHYDGASWQPAAEGYGRDLKAVWGSSSSDVFVAGTAGGFAGTILHYDGSGWTTVSSGGVLPPLRGLWGTSANDVFAVGVWGTLLHYDGKAWSAAKADIRDLTSTLCADLLAVNGATSGDGFIVGDGNFLLRHCAYGPCP